MKFRSEISRAFRLIKVNIKSLIGFELIYKLAVTVIASFIIKHILLLSINLSPVDYLTSSNFISWLFSPFSIPLLIIILFIATFVSLIDVLAVIYALHAASNNEKVSVREMLVASVMGVKRILKPSNWGIIIFILLLVPLVSSGASSGFVSQLEIPGFISDFISANTVLNTLFITVSLILWALAFVWMLSIHIFNIENLSFKQACTKSFRLIKKHFLHSAISIGLWNICVFLAYLLVAGISIGAVCLLISQFVDASNQFYLALIISIIIVSVLDYLVKLIIVPINFTYLSCLYYTYLEKEGQEKPKFVHVNIAHKKSRIIWKTVAIATSVVLVFSIAVEVTYRALNYMMPDFYATQKIAAHRGSSASFPENTMPAFERAILEGCEWVELDVHQTKDGVVIVCHDDNLKRIAGVNLAVYDLTYEEIMQYDVGSWFAPEYSDLRILTLDEVIKALKGRVKINIELKPTGNEENFEQNVIDVVNSNDFASDCVLASLNVQTVKTVKALDENIQTLYLLAFVQGDLLSADFADGFSIEESSITPELVTQLHDQGKEVWAWTLNTSSSVEKMQEYGVDYILTDYPVMARSALATDTVSDLLESILKNVFPMPVEVAQQSTAADA